MYPNTPQKPFSSLPEKQNRPDPITISAPDHHILGSSTAQGTPTISSNPSAPTTPRHRRWKAHIDAAAARDAWSSSPRSNELTKLPGPELREPMFLQEVSPSNRTQEVHIQARAEHGVDVIDRVELYLIHRSANRTHDHDAWR